MSVEQGRIMRMMRALGCTALLALLAVCGYMGAQPPQTAMVSVPVAVETISESALSAGTLEQTREKLKNERENALLLWQSVLDDPSAGDAERKDALAQKTELAQRMEKEAAACAVLEQMGFGEAAVVISAQTATVIVPWQAAENEQNRVKIIDAAASHTGLPPESVKIILSKK